MRKISQFAESGPTLARQCSQLEQNVEEEFDALESIVFLKLTPTNIKATDYAANLGEMVIVDTTSGNVKLTLPVSSFKNGGQAVALVMLSASHNCVVSAADGSATVNRATSETKSGIGLTRYESAGIGWFS